MERPLRSHELRRRHTLAVQIGLIASLALVLGAFSVSLIASPTLDFGPAEPRLDPIENPEVVPTSQYDRHPPAPPVPLPPIAVDDVLDEDLAPIELDDVDLNDPRLTPVGPPDRGDLPDENLREDEEEPFIVVEQMPEVVGGLAALQRRVRYPELARRAGIEGMVVVQFVVDEEGRVSELVCLREPGGGTCEAAMEAVRQSAFVPGRQRGRAVTVRFSLPVHFRLSR